ncbi:MAG: membrane lipoprotein lipid attachment site-containing protein [Candidatus Izimaplasma sp.]|nr:membrane lipoprotein lipid attachment site-containing protein [Candidatus Izimaplasma bacterium]
MKKIILALFSVLILSGCHLINSDDYTRRVELDENYPETVAEEIGITNLAMIVYKYFSNIELWLNKNDIYYEVPHPQMEFAVVFGYDTNDDMKAIIIPGYLEMQVTQLPISFSTYDDFLEKINEFNSNEELPNIENYETEDELFIGIVSTNRINDDTYDSLDNIPENSIMISGGSYRSPNIGDCYVYLIEIGENEYAIIANNITVRENGYEVLVQWSQS